MRWNIIVECVGEYGKQSTITLGTIERLAGSTTAENLGVNLQESKQIANRLQDAVVKQLCAGPDAARRCCSTRAVRYSTANWANTPGGRPQNHRRSRPWRHEPQVLSGPDLSAVNDCIYDLKYSSTAVQRIDGHADSRTTKLYDRLR